ncbi:hypothetical protein A2U01_0020857, partial [Trifolium medium]|nr:hypothetical protein [Trifolium medium]
NLFAPNNGDHTPIVDTIPHCVSDNDNHMLTSPFIEEEFQQAVFSMHPDKSPGPDGLNPAFYQKFWPLCGKDIFEACCSWLEDEHFPSDLNDTNIALIAKVDRPDSMKDLRLISLCNVIYKILSKVLANRLKRILPNCISESQVAFVPEGLSSFIHHYETRGLLHGIRICRGSPSISHLFFTDDSFLFCKATISEATNLKHILDTYEVASGQAINYQKSAITYSHNL